MNWSCVCGNFVREKRFCPRCKLMRFSLKNAPILDYWGLRLGDTANGLPFCLPVDYLKNHVLITGQTGTGKTRFGMNLVIKAENHESIHPIKFLAIDVEGEWKNVISKIKKPCRYYSVGSNLKINPFDLKDPALIRDLMRETVFKGIEKEFVDLSAQMNFVLQETISESTNMDELIRNIKRYDRQNLTSLQKTKTALLVRLDPFLRSPLKEIFFCRRSNPDFTKLDETNVIIDLHALDALVAYKSELRLIYNVITVYFLRKMLNRSTINHVSHLFVGDEAQLLVPKILRKIIVTESWPATEFATRLRKRGCGIVLITQSPSNIEKDIFKNTMTKVSFRLQHQEDIRIIADSCGFTDITEQQYLSEHFVKMPQKIAIISAAGHEPFQIRSHDFEITESDVAYDVPEDAIETREYSQDEEEFLEIIKNEPFLKVRERRAALGWNERRYYHAVNSLLKENRIEIQRAKLGRGSPTVLYQTPGQIPSVRHEFYVNWICQKLESKGFTYTTNIKDGPDIVIPKINTAIDVELGSSNMQYNMQNNSKKFDKVIVCSDQKKLLETLSSENKSQNVLFLQIQNVPIFFEKMQDQNQLVNK